VVKPASFHLIFPRSAEELDALEADWERLASRAPWIVPLFADVRRDVEADPATYCVAVARGPGGVDGIAFFQRALHRQRFSFGERQIGELDARAWRLHRDGYAGSIPEIAWREAFRRLSRHGGFDILILGEVVSGAALMQAARRSRWPLLALDTNGRESVHWIAELPGSFDAYFDTLRASTRQSLRRKMKRFEREADGRLEVISRCDQVDHFLKEGEAISRQTYQWDVGQRLEADPATRERYLRLAAEGRLRCYLLYAEGRPIAFLRGELVRSTYLYETPGFLAEFERFSPGLVLLVHAIRDLAESTPCTIFDFGEGGDNVGYKSRFGTCHVNCRHMAIANVIRPRGLAVWFLVNALNAIKASARAVLGEGEFKRKLKKAIRKYDDPEVKA
jgi:CelD/BcsL family acetyltransferase involved in cellulose biosynthesis